MSTAIITCLYQLKEQFDERRTYKNYLKQFNYIYSLGLPIIFFTEEDLISEIKKYFPLCRYEVISFTKLINYEEVINKNLSKQDNGFHYTTNEFSILTNNKPYFLKLVKDKYPEFEHLIYLDVGIGHHTTILVSKLKEQLLALRSNKIIVAMMKCILPNEIIDHKTFMSLNRGRICGGLVVIPKDKVDFFYDETLKYWNESITYEQLVLEETVWALAVAKNYDHFDFVFGSYSFLPNLAGVSKDLNIVLDSLEYARVGGLSLLGTKMVREILRGCEYINYPTQKLDLTFWYNAQIVSYYHDKDLSLLCARMIWMICRRDSVEFLNAKQNCSYVGIDIDQEYHSEPNSPELKYNWESLL